MLVNCVIFFLHYYFFGGSGGGESTFSGFVTWKLLETWYWIKRTEALNFFTSYRRSQLVIMIELSYFSFDCLPQWTKAVSTKSTERTYCHCSCHCSNFHLDWNLILKLHEQKKPVLGEKYDCTLRSVFIYMPDSKNMHGQWWYYKHFMPCSRGTWVGTLDRECCGEEKLGGILPQGTLGSLPSSLCIPIGRPSTVTDVMEALIPL